MNPTTFSETQIIEIRNEIIDYITFLIDKFIRLADKKEEKKISLCDTNEIFNIIGFDKDIIIWCFLGDHPNKKEWGFMSSKFPHLNSIKYILNNIEIPRICLKYNIQNEFGISYRIKKNMRNLDIKLRKINNDFKFNEKLQMENEELFYENDLLKQEIKSKEMRIISMEREIDILKSYLMLKN